MTQPLDGLLVVDKPVGPTSHDVVAKVRRACRGARVGHTGTLDPMASGVLVLVIGRATRLAQFLSASDKSYEATVRIGIETDTYDAEGAAVAHAGAPCAGALDDASRDVVVPRAPEVEQALGQFRGTYDQRPPPFSAKKVAGARAYELARQQRPVALAPVPVAVHALELIACDGDLVRITVTCSAGFYVRVLAHELGRALGCGAHLAALRRTRSGQFGLEAAIPLERATAGADAVAASLVPLDAMLPEMRAARMTARGAERTRHGRALEPDDIDGWLGEPPATGPTGPVRLLDPDGHLVAIGARRDNGLVLHPGIVLV
jgi:tRNA pseudouridine55 synthase